MQLDPGLTPDEAIDLIVNGDGESIPGEEINILGRLSAGRTAYVDVTLDPWQYLAVCFWRDTEHDGIPHIFEGMSAAHQCARSADRGDSISQCDAGSDAGRHDRPSRGHARHTGAGCHLLRRCPAESERRVPTHPRSVQIVSVPNPTRRSPASRG